MNSGSAQRHAPSSDPDPNSSPFLAGVIEGFYGQPWSQTERCELFEWMSAAGLNTYLYAPKDDLKHRSLWREPYSADEIARLRELVQHSRQLNLRFIYALSPGLDIRYSNPADGDALKKRFAQLIELGCRDFALLFDDIPDRMDPADRDRWTSFASAQSHLTNAVFQWSRGSASGGRFLFCPTPYCGRMAERQLGGPGYLQTIGQELLPEIEVLWTGPEIVSREISLAHLEEVRATLRRRPVLWDNLHANDYDVRRFYCGPYSGRPLEIKTAINGLLANPNSELPLNFVPLRTLAAFVHREREWDGRRAYLAAMQEWLPRFDTIGQPISFDDLVLLGDCHYLPYEEGPEAEALYQMARGLISTDPKVWSDDVTAAFQGLATRLRDCCIRLTELRERPLFYALSRRLWELREELDLLLGWIRVRYENRNAGAAWHSDFHLPNTYRGGLLRRLERLLTQQPDGTFAPAESNAASLGTSEDAQARETAGQSQIKNQKSKTH